MKSGDKWLFLEATDLFRQILRSNQDTIYKVSVINITWAHVLHMVGMFLKHCVLLLMSQ